MPTISDVARQAGVSTVTVSRVLNNAPNVSIGTREKVEQAIDKLGYVPNVVARSLRSKRTHSLALIVPDITNPFWTTVARGVEDAAQSSGYCVLLCNTDESCAKQLRYLDLVSSRRVDGVIIAPFDSDLQNIRALRDREVATVLVDRRVAGWEPDSVRGDSMGGAQALVRHLVRLGHRRIAMISGPCNTSTAEDRVDGYRVALAEAGINPDSAFIRRGEFRTASGEQLMGQLLDEGIKPTAIFAANNAIAMGAIDAVTRRGLRIPHDIALVCFDDFDAASHLFPFLTVAVQPAYEMGVRAAQLLLSRIEAGAALTSRHVLLPTRLIIRHSCGSHLRDLGGGSSELALPLAGVAEDRAVLVEPALALACPRFGRRQRGYHMKVMTSRKRVLTAFEHQEPDHVPCWMGASPEFKGLARNYLGLPDDESLAIYIGDDFRRVYTSYTGPDDCHPTRNLTHPEATYRTPFGIERYGYGYGMPLHFPLKDARSVDEVDAYPWPDPEWLDVSHIREDALQYERRYAILGGEWSPFWHDAIDLLDFDGLIYRMYDDPEVVDAVMTHVTDYYLEVSRRTFEASGDAIDVFFIGNDFGAQTGPMISPRLFRRFILPHLKRLADLGHEYGRHVLLHCDGSIRALIPDMIAVGIDGLQSVQPLCHGMNLAGLKADYGKCLTFVGGIDTQSLIEGSADEARHLTRKVLQIMMPGGGFIASPSHDYLLPETPVENVIIMYDTIKEYGAYS